MKPLPRRRKRWIRYLFGAYEDGDPRHTTAKDGALINVLHAAAAPVGRCARNEPFDCFGAKVGRKIGAIAVVMPASGVERNEVKTDDVNVGACDDVLCDPRRAELSCCPPAGSRPGSEKLKG